MTLLTENSPRSTRLNLLLLAWFVTLPFGSMIGGFSIGFMTLYPNLVIGAAIFLLSVTSFRQWLRIEKVVFLFFVGWLLIAAFQSWKISGLNADAIFDLRSLGMQVLVTGVIFGSRNVIGTERFFSTITSGVLVYTFVLFVSGAFEWLTSIHIVGSITQYLFALPESHIALRAPMFNYQNVNDYLLHLIFFFTLSCVFFDRLRRSTAAQLCGWVTILFFSAFAQSRGGLIASTFALSLIALYQAIKVFNSGNLRKSYPYVFGIALMVLMFAIQPLYLGPEKSHIPSAPEETASAVNVPAATKVKQLDEMSKREIESAIEKDPELSYEMNSSNNLRTNLILNGITMMKRKPLFGVGAGNYRVLSREDESLKYTSTVDSAHFFPIEILSQFGATGWLYLLLLIWIFYRFIREGIFSLRKLDWKLYLFLVIPVLWILPSSYLYLETHRLLVPLLICLLVKPRGFSTPIDAEDAKSA